MFDYEDKGFELNDRKHYRNYICIRESNNYNNSSNNYNSNSFHLCVRESNKASYGQTRKQRY